MDFQGSRLLDRSEGSTVEAERAQHTFGAAEGAEGDLDRTFGDGARIRSRAFIKPREKLSFATHDEALRNAGRKRQNPPPHRSLSHCIRGVDYELGEKLFEHGGDFHIDKSSYLIWVIRGPQKGWMRAHIVRS